MFRALQPSEAPGSGGVLGSGASGRQRRLSARGVEPAGRGGRGLGFRPFGGIGIGISNALFRQAEEYGCTRGLSRTRSVGPGCGMFRALQPFESPGSGGVLGSGASGRQRRLLARGVEPAGRGGRGLGSGLWSRSNDRAGDRGGARAGKPRWVRILAITGGSSMVARIVKVPPHCGHCSMSISNTRLSNRAQPRRAGAEGWGASA